jgi:hypothetical protein
MSLHFQLNFFKTPKYNNNFATYFTRIDTSASISLLLGGKNFTVTLVSDGKDGGAEELTASGTKLNVVAIVVMDGSLGKHGIVLNLGLAERGAVASNDDKLS